VEYIDEDSARFYGACVLDAFDYLHGKSIVYRCTVLYTHYALSL
jgi:hypothetical protein